MTSIYTTSFNRNIHGFLIREGYTHIFAKGVSPDGKEDEYVVVPLKPDELLRAETTWNVRVQNINEHDVIDMADGYPLIHFVVELPVNEYEKYLREK